MTETIPQPRVAEEADLADSPGRRAGAARLRPAPVRGQRGPPRPHPVEQPRPAHRHGRHPIEEIGRPEPAGTVRGDGCDGHRGRPGGRPQPGRPGRRHRGDRRRDHRRAPRRRPARGRAAAGGPERPRGARSSRSKRSSAPPNGPGWLPTATSPPTWSRPPSWPPSRASRPRPRSRPSRPQATTRATTALGDVAEAASATPAGRARFGDAAPAALSAVDAAALAAASAGRPVAIIRAVSDGGFGPGMVTGGMAALRVAARGRAGRRALGRRLPGADGAAGRAPVVLRRGGAGDRDRRARPRAARRAGLRAQADRAQHPGRVRPRAARRDLRRRARRGAQRRDGRVLRPRRRARGPLRRRPSGPCRSSTRPARWCRRCTRRRAGSPRRGTRSR